MIVYSVVVALPRKGPAEFQLPLPLSPSGAALASTANVPFSRFVVVRCEGYLPIINITTMEVCVIKILIPSRMNTVHHDSLIHRSLPFSIVGGQLDDILYIHIPRRAAYRPSSSLIAAWGRGWQPLL